MERKQSTTTTDLADAEVLHRYLQLEDRRESDDLVAHLEIDWFTMGGQEAWMESRPRDPRTSETPRRP